MPRTFSFLILALLHGANAFQSAFQGVGRPVATLFSTTTAGADTVVETPTTTTASTTSTATSTTPKNKKVSVLLCPAQFCVPQDYQELFENLRNTRAKDNGDLPEIGTCRVAELPRTEWIKVARQLPTRNFFDATLNAKQTLDWYFAGMEKALSEIYAEQGTDASVCIIGHSIGGWVARAYLGGLGVYVLFCIIFVKE